jgi:arylsulfatase A-like enzyme
VRAGSLIIYDPSAAALRGRVSDALIETIDLIPTFLHALGQPIADHVLEGRSLLSLLHGGAAPARDAVFCELDYGFYEARRALGLGPDDARAVMVRTKEWKLVHYDGFDSQLYDLLNDLLELEDRGQEAGAAGARKDLYGLLFAWMRRRRNRITMRGAEVLARDGRAAAGGVVIGQW